MRYCSTCLYPAPCGRCEDSEDPAARIDVYLPLEYVHCRVCDQWVQGSGPWCQLYDPLERGCQGADLD